MAKKQWEFQKEKISGHVCSGCINIFPDAELSLVTMPAGYATPFCTPCIQKEGIAQERIKGNLLELNKLDHKQSNPWKKK